MRQILLFTLLLSGITAFSQTGARPTPQTGSIKGVIRTSDGNPAESVSIGIKGTSIITVSDKAGKYGSYGRLPSMGGVA